MADGYGASLPLKRHEADGYSMVKTFVNETKQNFKILLLTNPGERVMDLGFGIGIKKFLFEPQGPLLYQKIEKRIKKQVQKYLSHVVIQSIEFGSSTTPYKINPDVMDTNDLSIRITYKITTVGKTDTISSTTTAGSEFTLI